MACRKISPAILASDGGGSAWPPRAFEPAAAWWPPWNALATAGPCYSRRARRAVGLGVAGTAAWTGVPLTEVLDLAAPGGRRPASRPR